MPTPLTRPSNFSLPFSASGTKNTIPVSPSGSYLASFTEGFPPITMLPYVSGGLPPDGKDFNGVLFDIMSHTVWVNGGGQYQFDATLATAIGGYPVGVVLQNNAGTAAYVNAVANNSTDFNSTPSSIGVSWLPWAGQATSAISVATTGGTTTLTAIQAAAKVITISGTLVSNATVTVPAALGEWQVVNNTTGGTYTVTVIASGGSGVPVLRGGSDKVFCDGSNVRYVEASAITQAANDNSKALATTEYVDRAAGLTAFYFYGQFH